MSDNRYNQFNLEQMQIGKAAIPAIVLLNSAAFLAMLSKVDAIVSFGSEAAAFAGDILWYWGVGAACGIGMWLFTFLNANLVTRSAIPGREPTSSLSFWIIAAMGASAVVGIVSVILFLFGVHTLSAGLETISRQL